MGFPDDTGNEYTLRAHVRYRSLEEVLKGPSVIGRWLLVLLFPLLLSSYHIMINLLNDESYQRPSAITGWYVVISGYKIRYSRERVGSTYSDWIRSVELIERKDAMPL